MKPLRGTALFCGIGNTIEEMKAHLEQDAFVGINAVFTSQLPEANKGFPLLLLLNLGIKKETSLKHFRYLFSRSLSFIISPK